MSRVTSAQLQDAVTRELERVENAKETASHGQVHLRGAAWADYKTGAGRLREKAGAMLPRIGEQYDWCNANPRHPEQRSIEDSCVAGIALYHKAHQVADAIDADKLKFGDRRLA